VKVFLNEGVDGEGVYCRSDRGDRKPRYRRSRMLRPYRDDDLEAVLDVWYRASLIAHSFLSEEFLEAEQHQIAEEFLPVSETTVAEADGRVVGFLSLIGTEVGGIFVDPEYQGRGIGRTLMDDARRARTHLELGVFEDNLLGRRFYDAYGFLQVDRQIHAESGHYELRLRLDYSS
jgi:putative acetyltransferase